MSHKQNQPPTLRSVAERAGVHLSLVSRVLRNDPSARLADDKRLQIIEIAQAMGYRPNRLARSLRVQRSLILAMLVPDITNPFHAAMFRSVEAIAQNRGYHVILCNTDDDDARFRSLVRLLSEGHVDGLVIASAKHDDETIDWLHTQPLPFVLLNRRRTKAGDPWVGPDDFQMGVLGAEHLARNGHRELLLLIGDLQIDNMHRRADGFFETLKRFGIAKRKVTVRSNLNSHEDARAAVAALTPNIRTGQISAVFALSTIASNGGIAALANAGIRWPNEVSFVGYTVSRSPDVTSIRPPVAEMAIHAANYLIDKLESTTSSRSAISMALPVELIDVGSTASIAK